MYTGCPQDIQGVTSSVLLFIFKHSTPLKFATGELEDIPWWTLLLLLQIFCVFMKIRDDAYLMYVYEVCVDFCHTKVSVLSLYIEGKIAK